MSEVQKSKTSMKTGKVRFSYLNAFEAKAAQEGQKPKFSVALLIPKSDKATVARIDACVEAAKELGKSKLVGTNGKYPPNLKTPLRDGDLEKPDDENYAGHWFMNASSGQKPGIVDANLQPIMSEAEIYSGCYGRADVNFYAFNTSGNKGVACSLNNLQKLEDGEPLAGRMSAAAAFGEDNDLL